MPTDEVEAKIDRPRSDLEDRDLAEVCGVFG
jgi:hypothetical protein